MSCILVTCKSYFIKFKARFGQKFWELFPCELKILLHNVRFNPHEVRLNQMLDNSKHLNVQVRVKGGRLWSDIMLLAISDVSYYQNSWKYLHGCTIKNKDKNWTPIHVSLDESLTWTCCWPSWMSAITENGLTTPLFKIETCSENQTPLSFDKFLTLPCYWPSWMVDL